MDQIDAVTKDILRICVPIPFPLKTVNVYALIGEEGWTLIDTAIGTPETRAAFYAGLEQAGLSIKRLQAIVLTHHHPDHIGLSGELQEQSGAPVYMHPLDKATLALFGTPHAFAQSSHFFAQHGLSSATKLRSAQAGNTVSMQQSIHVPRQETIQTVEDGEELLLSGQHYRVIWTPGHADGQVCLYRPQDRIFLAADHVLPRITPNIGLYSEQARPDPLDDYLKSLEKVADLPASMVLPGHGAPFTGLAARVAEIKQHHVEREQQILHLLEHTPQNATQLAGQLFGSRLNDAGVWRMGVAEVIAHLEYMCNQRVLMQQITQDGQLIYAPLNSIMKRP
jgi:glyoxylase-like metal-dependent hydrolase (beta-lactamase superfamily II)